MQKIHQFNQYLLERYPTIWNTKIIWMLLVSVLIHILFFVIGYCSHMDPRSLQTYSVKDDYFKNGVIFIHLIISILMIVGWLITMFRNNAFKNFYPTSKGKLFGQFVQYFIILFACTTFYFSYMVGFKMFINHQYPDQQLEKSVDIINRAAPFLSQELEPYALNNRKYPAVFADLFCETDINKINTNKKYFIYYNRVYQFYSVYSKVSDKLDREGNSIIPEPEKTNKTPVAYSELKGDQTTFYFKKDVVDLSPYIKTTGLSYYNFSDIFYDNSPKGAHYLNQKYGEYPEESYTNKAYKQKAFEINQKTSELLNKGNSAELESLLSDFLKIAEAYKIQTNLQAKEWTKMIYSSQNNNFQPAYFINKVKSNNGTYDSTLPKEYMDDSTVAVTEAAIAENGNIVRDSIAISVLNPEINQQVSPEKYFKNNLTDYYFYTDSLKDVLNNINTIKNFDFFSENVHIYLWIAFFLAAFIFSFRIVGLRSLLFSVISTGVLILAITLLSVLYSFSLRGKGEFFASYFTLFISAIILIVPLFMMRKAGKMISSIFLTISMTGFALFVFLIFGIISLHQKENCMTTLTGNSYIDCPTIIDTIGLNLSYIILVCSFIFMYLYTSILQKWKAMPQ
ncbi:hypothetical protein [Chryseobacterium paridis]|uniref:ABC transporter permease n=1 Tax=Chryseobacterium paridis TaxID=2800328 RepID=A0ABS1FU90_9FLAO|nr:hypothetical protein [Chryseobacterium paridis]MBK1895997.1 hypothetical protein [Chryseobacterium paridis]